MAFGSRAVAPSMVITELNAVMRIVADRLRTLPAALGFSKKLANHVAAVSLYVAHYNLCRVHEAIAGLYSE